MLPQIEIKEEIYTCPVCNKQYLSNCRNYYKIGQQKLLMGCTVYHEPGSCCHFNDSLIEENNVSI